MDAKWDSEEIVSFGRRCPHQEWQSRSVLGLVSLSISWPVVTYFVYLRWRSWLKNSLILSISSPIVTSLVNLRWRSWLKIRPYLYVPVHNLLNFHTTSTTTTTTTVTTTTTKKNVVLRPAKCCGSEQTPTSQKKPYVRYFVDVSTPIVFREETLRGVLCGCQHTHSIRAHP